MQKGQATLAQSLQKKVGAFPLALPPLAHIVLWRETSFKRPFEVRERNPAPGSAIQKLELLFLGLVANTAVSKFVRSRLLLSLPL